MTPNQAIKGGDNTEIFLKIRDKAKFSRTYPPLKVGDMVRVAVKKTVKTKGTDSKWSTETYNVLAYNKDFKQYLVNTPSKRLYSRHDLLKIEAAEGKDDNI